jgi:hypothetical protein
LKTKSNFHLTDHENHPFGLDDFPFGYVSVAVNPPLKLLHGSAPMGKKREPTPRKDHQMAVEVRVAGATSILPRSGPTAPRSYPLLLSETVRKHGLTGPWHFAQVRAVDDRILVEIADGEPTSPFLEKVCPPLLSDEDRLFQASRGVGGWGISPPSPMLTRAAASKTKAKNKTAVDVLLHNLETDVVETIGKSVEYQDALALARKSGKVPKGMNVAVTEKTEDHILLVCKHGTIVAGEGVVSSVTPPKPKPKKTTLSSEKIAGSPVNPDAAFAPRHPVPSVPGKLNVDTPVSLFQGAPVRPLDPSVGFYDIRVEVLKEGVREVRVRKDIGDMELFAIAFQGLLIYQQEQVRLITKPMKMEDGAIFRFERVSRQVQLSLMIHFWDGTTRMCGVEVFRSATME